METAKPGDASGTAYGPPALALDIALFLGTCAVAWKFKRGEDQNKDAAA